MIEKQEKRREVGRRNVRLSIFWALARGEQEDMRGLELELELDVESFLFLPLCQVEVKVGATGFRVE